MSQKKMGSLESYGIINKRLFKEKMLMLCGASFFDDPFGYVDEGEAKMSSCRAET